MRHRLNTLRARLDLLDAFIAVLRHRIDALSQPEKIGTIARRLIARIEVRE